jgi:hypothetical protein
MLVTSSKWRSVGAHQVSTTQSLLKAHSKLLAVDEFVDILWCSGCQDFIKIC